MVFRLVEESVLCLLDSGMWIWTISSLLCLQPTWLINCGTFSYWAKNLPQNPSHHSLVLTRGPELALELKPLYPWNIGVCGRKVSRRNRYPPEIASTLKKQVRKHEKPCGGWGLIGRRSQFGFSSRCFREDVSNPQHSCALSMQSHPVGTENAVEDRLKWFNTFDFSTNTYLKSLVFCITILCWLWSEAVCNLMYVTLAFEPNSFNTVHALGIVIYCPG